MVCRSTLDTYGLDPEGVTEMGQVVKVSSSHFNKHTVPNQIITSLKKN